MKGFILAFLFLAGTTAARAECERGDVDALVDQCTQVSPATHPPCNAANACGLIVSEIRRGCGMLSGSDRPAFCDAYGQ